eukprot:7538034-Pyramimonas_sp.AAC.1
MEARHLPRPLSPELEPRMGSAEAARPLPLDWPAPRKMAASTARAARVRAVFSSITEPPAAWWAVELLPGDHFP